MGVRPCLRELSRRRERIAGAYRMRPNQSENDDGSAVLEFTFLGLLLLVPVVYLVLTIGACPVRFKVSNFRSKFFYP
ncbi:hypothetical protein GC088_09995 [Arthrobacter sp. JZ12]|nr:hypothetical protein GC088_09995 [Arthrobacter sp. JZ12]